jgi:excisionase family DNA binding protein
MKRAAGKARAGTRRRGASPKTPAPERSGRRWISPREAAELLGIHPMTVYDLVNRGELPAARLGRKVLIDRVRLEAQLEAQATGQGKAKGRL